MCIGVPICLCWLRPERSSPFSAEVPCQKIYSSAETSCKSEKKFKSAEKVFFVQFSALALPFSFLFKYVSCIISVTRDGVYSLMITYHTLSREKWWNFWCESWKIEFFIFVFQVPTRCIKDFQVLEAAHIKCCPKVCPEVRSMVIWVTKFSLKLLAYLSLSAAQMPQRLRENRLERLLLLGCWWKHFGIGTTTKHTLIAQRIIYEWSISFLCRNYWWREIAF